MVFFDMSEVLSFIKNDQNTCFTISFEGQIWHPDVHSGDDGPYGRLEPCSTIYTAGILLNYNVYWYPTPRSTLLAHFTYF